MADEDNKPADTAAIVDGAAPSTIIETPTAETQEQADAPPPETPPPAPSADLGDASAKVPVPEKIVDADTVEEPAEGDDDKPEADPVADLRKEVDDLKVALADAQKLLVDLGPVLGKLAALESKLKHWL